MWGGLLTEAGSGWGDWEATTGIQVQDPLGWDGRNVFCGFRAGHCGLFPDSRCLSVGVWRFSLSISCLGEGLRELACPLSMLNVNEGPPGFNSRSLFFKDHFYDPGLFCILSVI